MKTKIGFSALVSAALAMAAVTASAQVQISQDGRPERIFMPRNGMNDQDKMFLKNAAIANMFEIQSSEIAQDKSSDEFVKEYSKEMIADHRASLEELKQIAMNKGFTLPTDVPMDMKHKLMHMRNLSGGSFDAAYENAQTMGHSGASTLFKGEVRYGRDEDVKGYVVKTLPVVTMHYKMMLNRNTMMGSTQMKGGG